jgi:hypothetical protein
MSQANSEWTDGGFAAVAEYVRQQFVKDAEPRAIGVTLNNLRVVAYRLPGDDTVQLVRCRTYLGYQWAMYSAKKFVQAERKAAK